MRYVWYQDELWRTRSMVNTETGLLCLCDIDDSTINIEVEPGTITPCDVETNKALLWVLNPKRIKRDKTNYLIKKEKLLSSDNC